ncbi:tetratricopeptide repeat protein [Fundidesulfovibrio terrae]|uniref:tetratricopeptide repeat protein n=1 Tax=Fundidesulfovibrio terrae TaxID=2922866 RepID=UPI001FB00171|nr:tetratricopeptide repeat protein [Fundidesulfovibrio terrae]
MAKPKNAPQARQETPAPQTMVRKQSAVALAVVMLLAGVFIGWQGAVIVFNQEAAQGGKPAGMPGGMPQQAQGQQAPQGMNPMSSLMAQAKTMEEQAAKSPNDPAVWAKLGDTYFDAELPDRAVAAYQKSLALKPGQADVWTDMGVMLRSMNKYQEALKAFEQAVAIDSKHQQARLNTGVVYLFDLKDKQAAIKAWQDLLAVNPEAKMPDGKRVADAVKELGGK